MGSGIDLRPGPWETALAGVERFGAVITDPPYSARNHNGHDAGSATGKGPRRPISYAAWGPEDVARFVDSIGARCEGWFCVMTSHDLAPAWEDALGALGRYVFAPVPVTVPGSRVRLAGDGPSCWSVWLIVSRPRREPYSRWGTLPGEYRGKRGGADHIGGKPLPIMRAIVRDYTRPGDLVCDPCAGLATTLVAADIEGRRAIGAEVDPDTYELARARIARGRTSDLFAGAA